jgi:hypothetical protein
MSEETLQQQIYEINARLKKWEQEPPLQDHQHNGIDASKVRFKDLDVVFSMQTTLNPSSLVDGAGETLQVTGVAGATLGDWVLISAPYDLQDITVTAYVQATGVVEIRLQNESGNTINLASGIWRILIIRKVV